VLRAGPGSDPPRAPRDPPSLATAGGATRANTVVELAREAMGTPYRWGGSDQNGFDCSGLIRYAYGEVGVDLPRRSRDQARSGREVTRDVALLLPGDILAFGAGPGGGEVTHVGLYLGQGRFIHSASGGVRISPLDDRDRDGRWWLERWLGARRVLE
jgi:cell wall-associated NlpC family hydrolase